MARNRELLSDKDFFAKTKHIVEHVRGCKINITYWRDGNYVKDMNLGLAPHKLNTSFRLNISTPAEKGIEKFTALNHELGHILMKSPMAEAKNLINAFYLDMYGEFSPTDGATDYYNVFWNAFNVLEDQRIESLMAKLWLANGKRFRQTKRKLGKLRKEKITKNPVDQLLMIRFYRTDLTEKTKYYKELKLALDSVENTGRYGALLQLRKLKPILEEYIRDRRKRKTDLTTKLNKIDETQSDRTKTREKLDELRKEENNKMENTPDFNTEITKETYESQEEWDELKEKILDDELTENEMDDIQNEMINDGKEELSDIKESMTDGGNGDLTPSYVLRVGRKAVNSLSIDTKVSKQLRMVFRKITEIHKPKIGYDGDDIDTEVYIENKARGSDLTKCFIDKKLDNGASILISIDGSGSMNYSGKIDKVRKLVSTLFDSVEDYPNINLKANVWSSNYKGDVGVTDINNKEDCKQIVVENTGGCSFTPTHLALDYSAKQISKMKGRKKILILLTDGNPEYSNNNYKLKRNILSTMCKKAFLKTKRTTENVIILHVGGRGCGSTSSKKQCKYAPYNYCNSCYSKMYLEECFGVKNVTSVPDMDEASSKIVQQFRTIVSKALSM